MAKRRNSYSDLIIDGLFDRTPKAVFAALYVSECINRLGMDDEEVNEAILSEWNILYENGIVPQKPPSGKSRR